MIRTTVRPIDNRCLIKPITPAETTPSGLIRSVTNNYASEGTVVAVGAHVSQIFVGEIVAFHNVIDPSMTLDINGTQHYLIKENEIQAVIIREEIITQEELDTKAVVEALPEYTPRTRTTLAHTL